MLDAIRGVAALAVAAGHVAPWFGVPLRFWLAVDLFFLLSGFVLAEVYGPRFADGVSVRRFMTQRYIRLYPLFLAGLLFGAAMVAASRALGHGRLDPAAFAWALATGLLLLPSPVGDDTGAVMPLNTPGWSLFFELAANLLFAAAWRWLTDAALLGLVAASAVGLAMAHAHGAGFGGMHLWDFGWGFPRVGFSFFLGVLMQRRLPRRRFRTDWAWLLVPLLLAVFLHRLPHGDLLDALTVALVFPALLAAAALVEPRRTAACAWLGALSYPLYAIHNPLELALERVFHAVGWNEAAHAPWPGLAFLAGAVPLALWLDRRYDQPVRRALARRLSARAARLTEAATPL